MMARYTVLIDGRAGAYGAAFPDCPGCTAMGATLDEALTNAAAALSEWMADRVNVSLDAGLLEEVDAAARARGLTRSAFLASAAREKIAAEG